MSVSQDDTQIEGVLKQYERVGYWDEEFEKLLALQVIKSSDYEAVYIIHSVICHFQSTAKEIYTSTLKYTIYKGQVKIN